MRVVFTPEAEASLERIGDYIAQDSPGRAVSFIAELAEAFPLVPRYAKLGVRRLPHGRYLILYRPRGDCVIILRVVHGARGEATWLDFER